MRWLRPVARAGSGAAPERRSAAVEPTQAHGGHSTSAPPTPTFERARELARLTHDSMLLGVALSPDGTRIAIAGADMTARVWDSADGRELTRLTHDEQVWCVAFSPDGARIATASDDMTARVWDSAGGRELARLTHDSLVWGVALSHDGARIATASADWTARVWDSAGGEIARVWGEE